MKLSFLYDICKGGCVDIKECRSCPAVAPLFNFAVIMITVNQQRLH